MKVAFAFFLLIGIQARADIFVFGDLSGFKKCMDTDHLEENTATATGTQRRYLSHIDIQVRCIEVATKSLATEKNKDTLIQYITATNAVTSPENSLPLVTLLAEKHRASCNEMSIYRVFLKGLSYPKSRIDKVLTAEMKKAVKICLKDPEFRKDFLDEKTNANEFIRENACEILKEENLVKKC